MSGSQQSQASTAKHKGGSWPDAVAEIFKSTPAWMRAIVLLLIVCAAVLLAAVFGQAVYMGREVSLWPPHVAAYEAPLVTNCKTLMESLPRLQENQHTEIQRIQDLIRTQTQALVDIEKEKDGNINSKVSIQSRLDQLNEQLAPLQAKMNTMVEKVVSACNVVKGPGS